MYKHILFDIDGTIIDTLPAIVLAANNAVKKFNFKREKITLLEAKNYMGYGTPYLIEHCFKQAKLNYEPIIKYYISQQLLTHPKLAKPYKNTYATLAMLSALDYSFYIATNKPQVIANKIVPMIFGKNMFKCIYGQNGKRKKKPDPEVINDVVNKFKLNKKECLYVGDSYVDILTAKNAHIDCCLVAHGYADYKHMNTKDAKFIIHEMDELFNVLE